MPPRLNKRQQRELEELEALKSVQKEKGTDSSEDEPVSRPSFNRGAGAFSNFLAAEEEEDIQEDEEEAPKSRKSKKKKKKPASATVTEVSSPKFKAAPSPTPPVLPRNEKKALKKARAKEKKAANDELDQVLAELSIQYPPSQRISQAEAGKQSLADLLSVSLQNLDGEAEMRRFFGSRVVTANRSEQTSRKKVPQVKSNLTRPQPSWWAAKGREGLSIRLLTEDEVAKKCLAHGWNPIEEKWWTVEYSKKYKSMTKAFMSTVLSGDPQGFWDLLSALPWHADTLLQLSEVYRHRDEHAQAIDFIERALFTYERAFIGSFTFTTGLNRLDFDRVENRPFYLAIHRQVTDLQRRGCVRTAFEFARLMYSLDPWSDPHGALLHLDFLAIKAGMSQWLLDVYELFEGRRKNKKDDRLNACLLPGWTYARALALKIQEDSTKDKDHTRSTAALREAILDFPSIVPLLADKLDVSLSADIRGRADFKIETDASFLTAPFGVLHLLSHLYAQRSAPVWKENSTWFAKTVTNALSPLPPSLPNTDRRREFLLQYEIESLCHSVYRHIMVLETSFQRLFAFIPKPVLDRKTLACDPLPPSTHVSYYDNEFFEGVEDMYTLQLRSRRQQANAARRLEQFIPDQAFREQLQAFFDAHPNLAQRFPGGILQFAQVAAQLPPDVLEDVMLAAAMNPDEQAGAMPGAFADIPEDELLDDLEVDLDRGFAAPVAAHAAIPAENDDAEAASDEEYNDEDDDDDEDISPMPRMLRNVLRRFWGGGAQADESSSEDDVPRDNTGVD